MNLPKPLESCCGSGADAGRCELSDNLNILRSTPMFSGIALPYLKLYAYLSRRMCYRTGDFLFRQGDADDQGYIILSGKVQVIREYKDRSVLLHEFSEGDFIGGLALLSDIKRLFSAKAITPLECLTLDRESFKKLLIQFPEVALKVLDVMIKRLVQVEEQLLKTQIDARIYG